jgi:hypothetical protein
MGYGLDGQIRITLKPGHDKNGVEQLVAALAEEVKQLRN